ncbi:MAG: bacteriohemerythrin [Proteobacteria bacterium]|nr:bacteriohemerythrin [Pseudomonadota bacterium]MBU1648324.1 bacteriohemerythrin [Pseudomonadota bacterium]
MEGSTFKWNAKYETGLAEVDVQHQGLVELINRLGTLRVCGGSAADVTAALDALADYAKYHFSTEDSLMQATGISPEHYEAHSRTHDLFLDQITRIVDEAQGDVIIAIDRLLRYLVKWLAFHILGQDKEMAVEIAALKRGTPPESARREAVDYVLRNTEVLFDAFNALFDDLDSSYAELRQSSEAQLKEAQRLAQLGSWELDLTNNHLQWSDEIYRIFEIDPEKFGASYEAFLNTVHPEDRESVDHVYQNSLMDHLPYEITHRLLMADGRIKYVHECSEHLYNPEGKPLRSIGTVQDVTLRIVAEKALRKSEERFRTVADYTYDWEYWRGPDNEFLYISPSCERITGYSASEFITDPGLLLKIIHPEDRDLVERHIRDEFDQEAAQLDFRIIRRDKKICWISHGSRPVYAKDGRFLGRRASNRDITDRKILEHELQRQAQFDYLTGLANRRYFIERGEEEIVRTSRYGRPMSLLMLDIDRFKEINDTHGHHAGDITLQMFAAHCQETLREIDIIGRVGGEEFAVILPETDGEVAYEVAERLCQSIANQTMTTETGAFIGLTVSIGLTTLVVGGEAYLDTLLRQADEALYKAKALGRNRVCTFSG